MSFTPQTTIGSLNEQDKKRRQVLNLAAQRYFKSAGDLFIYDGDYDTALAMIDKTLTIEPDNLRALVLKGDILFCLGQDFEALTILNEALKLNPNSTEALISKAGVLEVLGRFRDALSTLRQGLKQIDGPGHYLYPVSVELHVGLLLRLRRIFEGQAVLADALLHLSDSETQYLTANYGSVLGRYAEHRLQRCQARQSRATCHLTLLPAQSSPPLPA